MNKSCIIKAHQAGLFSLINNVITCAEIYEDFHVDWSDSLYSENGGNLWNYLFEPKAITDSDFDLIEGYEDQWLTYKNAGLLYKTSGIWRLRCNALWKKLTVIPSIIEGVEKFIGRHLSEPYISALVRSHGHAGEQLTDRSQSLEEYAGAIGLEMMRTGATQLYLACGDHETLDFMKRRFRVVSHPFAGRSATRDIDRHLAVPQTPQDAITCLQEVLIMSRAVSFIHPVSNMATAALYINPELRSVFLE